MKMLKYKNNVWFFVGVLLACFVVSVAVRYQQFETWKQTPNAYFVGEKPMMTTLDAPYWLRIAREFNEGVLNQIKVLRGYPEGTNVYLESGIPMEFRDDLDDSLAKTGGIASTSPTPEKKFIRYRDVPLLSFLIAHLSPFFNNNYFLTGTLLIPVLASLFILPLGFYCFLIGVPVSGLLGGLIGTFAGGYYMRSSIGRIDTDMLNLFFPLLVGLLILLAGRAKTERGVVLYAMGVGLSLFFFQWWYGKIGFTLAYFLVMVFSLFLQKVRIQSILLGSFLLVLCAQPAIFMLGTGAISGFLKGYYTISETKNMVIEDGTTPASFPNTSTTISEVEHIPMNNVLRRVISNITLDWIGFLAFFGLLVFKWRVLLPLFPMLALGLLSFQTSNRFIMYLAPFFGIGLGWLFHIVIEGVFVFWPWRHAEDSGKRRDKVKGKRGKGEDSLCSSLLFLSGKNTECTEKKEEFKYIDWWNWTRQLVLYLVMGVFFWLISGQTAISFVPGPSIHPRVYATFLEVKKRVPEDAALLTWWDYGYAITDATGLATFHDGGGLQQRPSTHFFARGLISHDLDELYDIIQYLATEGNRGIAENNTSPEALMKAVRNPQQKPWDPIYLFFTADMTGKYGAISKLGSWDIVKGGSKPRGYQNLACNKITNEEMNCRGAKIDFKAGKINNKVALKRMVFIQDGKVLREQEFENAQGYTLQLLVVDQRIVEVQLIDEVVFRSNYNQMFLLGRYDEELFEETYNAFPFSKLFRVKF